MNRTNPSTPITHDLVKGLMEEYKWFSEDTVSKIPTFEIDIHN